MRLLQLQPTGRWNLSKATFGAIQEQTKVCPIVSVWFSPTLSSSSEDGRYKVSLPLKEFHEPLADNYFFSVRRLRGLLQQLKHDREILKEYDCTIQEQLAKGVIEPLYPMKRPPIKCTISLTTMWSAVTRQPPSCISLWRIFEDVWPIVEQMPIKGTQISPAYSWSSHSIQILQSHSYCQCGEGIPHECSQWEGLGCSPIHLGGWCGLKEPELCVYRFTRVVFGVSSNPFLLNTTVKYHLEQFFVSNEATV